MMKFNILLLTFLTVSLSAAAQNPYNTLSDWDNKLLGNKPVTESNEDSLFTCAVKFLQYGQLIKAGKILDRLYRLDTVSAKAEKYLSYRKQAETKITELLHKEWLSATFSIYTIDSSAVTISNNCLRLTADSLFFFNDNKIIRKTGVQAEPRFLWFINRIETFITYKDTGEKWSFFISGAGYWDVLILTAFKLIPSADGSYIYDTEHTHHQYMLSTDKRRFLKIDLPKLDF